jgi:RimJ/RimL family protein N-acetyltransferase
MTIDAAPVIETERLRLERWDERHTPLLVRLASMPEVMRFIGTGDPWPPLLAEDVARAERRHWEQHGFGWRATVDKETGRGIGLVSLNYAGEGTAGLDPGEREIGWWLEPDAWGRGFGTEGSAALRSRCRASSPGSSRPTRAPAASPARSAWSWTSRRPAAAASAWSSTEWTGPKARRGRRPFR